MFHQTDEEQNADAIGCCKDLLGNERFFGTLQRAPGKKLAACSAALQRRDERDQECTEEREEYCDQRCADDSEPELEVEEQLRRGQKQKTGKSADCSHSPDRLGIVIALWNDVGDNLPGGAPLCLLYSLCDAVEIRWQEVHGELRIEN